MKRSLLSLAAGLVVGCISAYVFSNNFSNSRTGEDKRENVREILIAFETDNLIVNVSEFVGTSLNVTSKSFPVPSLCEDVQIHFNSTNCGCSPTCPALSTSYDFRYGIPDVKEFAIWLDSMYQTQYVYENYFLTDLYKRPKR